MICIIKAITLCARPLWKDSLNKKTKAKQTYPQLYTITIKHYPRDYTEEKNIFNFT